MKALTLCITRAVSAFLPVYRHVVFAPSATDSYASSAFPGIGDALFKIGNTDAEWDRVEVRLKITFKSSLFSESDERVLFAFVL